MMFNIVSYNFFLQTKSNTVLHGLKKGFLTLQTVERLYAMLCDWSIGRLTCVCMYVCMY